MKIASAYICNNNLYLSTKTDTIRSEAGTETMPVSQPHHPTFLERIFGTSPTAHILNAAIVTGVAVALLIWVILPMLRLLLDIISFRRLRARSIILLEITPPAVSTKTPLATAQLIAGLHAVTRSH